MPGGLLSTFPKRRHKSPHGRPQGVTRRSGSLSDLPNSIVVKNWKSTAIFTEIEKDALLSQIFILFLVLFSPFLRKKPINTDVYRLFQAPRVGLEPTTTRLTAECSTIELSRIILFPSVPYLSFLLSIPSKPNTAGISHLFSLTPLPSKSPA